MKLKLVVREKQTRILKESEEHNFAELRRLLMQPSEKNWISMMNLFKKWKMCPDRDVAIDYAAAHLDSSWPDKIRTFRRGQIYKTNKTMPEAFLNPTRRYEYYSRLTKHIHNRTDMSLTAEGAVKLVESPKMENITMLGLEIQGPTGERAAGIVSAIVKSPHLHNLVELHMPAIGIYDEAALLLANSTNLPSLRLLNLRWNPLPIGESLRVLFDSHSLNDTEIITGERGHRRVFPRGRTRDDAPVGLFDDGFDWD